MLMEIDGYLENRLNHWASWYLRILDGGHGYLTRSIEGRLISEGGHIEKSNNVSRSLYIDEAAEEINKLLSELAQYNTPVAEAVKTEYIIRKPQTTKARTLHVSTAQYKIYISVGKAWLSGRLISYIKEKQKE